MPRSDPGAIWCCRSEVAGHRGIVDRKMAGMSDARVVGTTAIAAAECMKHAEDLVAAAGQTSPVQTPIRFDDAVLTFSEVALVDRNPRESAIFGCYGLVRGSAWDRVNFCHVPMQDRVKDLQKLT